ncbi:hypothetical protein FM076_03745 [Streptomyces albus subsp. chlorinus]|uniref:hypothetical protein n=1 Tax=Streptomyces albus TaxID=1888 RepID=UPI00156F49BA|nr:hypothetical protein [Streptomyces albus]NSC20375.1 hypothetical protein [Streptomyces albus subsp. chlorinus]
MHLAHHLAALGSLRSAPAARVTTLRAAELGADSDPAALLEAEQEIRADHEALVVLLSGQWGEPETVDLDPHLLAAADGVPVPEPERTLCQWVAELAVWTVEGRWTGVGVTRRAPGTSPHLLAAVGEPGRPAPHHLT